MVAICRIGEIFLKGNNRSFFERALVQNIKQKAGRVVAVRNRMLVSTDNPDKLRTVFGLTSFSPAVEVPIDIKVISETAISLLANKQFSTFRVHTQRLTKKGPSSMDVNIAVGDVVRKASGARVDLNNAELTIGIEIIDNNAYVFTEKIQCPGGLPYGVSGNVTVWMDDPYSELAALLMLKRGCFIAGAGTQQKNLPVLHYYNPLFVCSHTPLDKIDGPIVRGFSDGFKSAHLYPLVGMTEQDAQQRLEEYARVY